MTTKPAMSRAKLPKTDQEHWLRQNVMTRMFAVMAKRSWLRELQRGYPRNSVERYEIEHIFHATWEGQYAAMRWLIEFAGIEAPNNSNVVTIESFDGGVPMDSKHQYYQELKEVWSLCSEITSHPTQRKRKPGESDMNPIRLAEDRIHKAARILRDHFQVIYETADIPL